MSITRSRTVALLVAAAAAVSGCAALRSPQTDAASPPGVVRVRLMHRERAVPGALVTAVRNLGVALLEERVLAQTGSDGRAEFTLDPGLWHLSASGASPPVFGWYGSNPVQIRAGDTIEIAIPAVAAAAAATVSPAAAGEETVAGEVAGDSGPVSGAGVAFYLDASTQFRGPGYIEVQTGERGVFEARVSPGRYWLVSRRRSGAQPFGPLEVGDDFGFYPGNPLEVREGTRVTVRIPSVRVLKKSGWSGSSILRTRVSGTIRDSAGRPLSGFRAFLHAKATMLGKPDFVSEPSGPDGTYLIWVDREGVYYLGARAEIGRAREDRDVIGFYMGAPNHAIAVRPGALAPPAFDIVVSSGSGP